MSEEEITFTEEEKMLEKLYDYEYIEDLDRLSQNKYIRYYDGKVLKKGGLVNKVDDYIIFLRSGRFKWSINANDNKIYVKRKDLDNEPTDDKNRRLEKIIYSLSMIDE